VSAPNHGADAATDTPRLPAETAKKLQNLGTALAVAGIAACGAAWAADRERFAFSYLVAFMFVLTLGLGGLFFVMVQHITNAGWSVGPRRQMEWLAGILPVAAVLFIPIAANFGTIYAHWVHPHGPEAELIQKKAAYLNPTFFFIRAGVYFLIWSGLSWVFRTESAKQDETGDASHTLKLGGLAAPGLFAFALSLTFAAFDWMMSLDPVWYSTIYGVYVFAGSVVSSLALLALLTIRLQKSGLIGSVSTVEHRHDIGKLLFGFTVFWTYIAFSQFFLIWYANIPEETLFFLHRWEGSWKQASLALLFLHFIIPFALLMPRTVKRSYGGLTAGAVIILTSHYLDMYWNVMPNLDHHGMHVTWIDVAAFLGPVGVLAWWLARQAATTNLFPLKDPRLGEARKLVNL